MHDELVVSLSQANRVSMNSRATPFESLVSQCIMQEVLLAILAVCLLIFPLVAPGQTVANITIHGLEGELLEQATANITVAEQLPAATGSRALKRRLKQAVNEIDNALRANGYYSASITPRIEEKEGVNHFHFDVVKGDPIRVASVDIEFIGPGAEFPPFLDWHREFPLQEGDILVDHHYESAKTSLQRLARKYGFFDARLATSEIRVDIEAASADIIIIFQTGPRYTYGELQLEQDYFDAPYLERFFNIRPGQAFNNDDLQALHQRFAASPHFSSIRINPQVTERSDETVPVFIELQRKKRDRYYAGLGYSTDLGVRGKLGMERRYVNRKGHFLDALLDYAELRQQVLLRYNIPLTQPYSDTLSISYQYNDRRDEDLKSRVNGLDVSRIWKRGMNDWQYGIWLFKTDNELDGQFSEGRFLAATTGWSRTRADNRLFPRRGWQLGLNLVGASESLASTESFLQARANGTLILPSIGQDRLLLRGRLGRTLIDDFDTLPKQLRFYAGGDNSVRGYAFESLAPRNENGSLVGGDSLIFASAEYEHYFTPQIAGAVFWDTGNAFFFGEPVELAHGAGVGLHLNLPFGVFRLDVANALSKDDRPWRLHVTLRPDL
jgi:translocation and assembly module TamA